MKDYTFDFRLKASVTVEAESKAEAERIIRGVLDDCAFFTARENDGVNDDMSDSVEGECSIEGDLDLAQIDGEDV